MSNGGASVIADVGSVAKTVAVCSSVAIGTTDPLNTNNHECKSGAPTEVGIRSSAELH